MKNKLRFTVGDQVTFGYPNGTGSTGTIMKLGKQRHVIQNTDSKGKNCSWLIPITLIRLAESKS